MKTLDCFKNKLLLLFLINCAIAVNVKAQDNKKFWSDGKLNWKDFKENSINQGACELKYYLEYNYEKQKYKDTAVVRNVTSCYVNRDLSWINPEFKNEQYLRYNQVIFNITELYRRKLQYELDRTRSKKESNLKYIEIKQSCNTEIEEFIEKSENGKSIEIINQWEIEINNRLVQIKDHKIPAFVKNNFGFGIHAGYGSCFASGDFNDYADPTTTMVAGFDLSYKKYIFYANIISTQWKMSKTYAPISDLGKHLPMDIISLSLGYTFFDNTKFKFAPFAGYAYHSSSDLGWEESSNGYILGLNADVKLRHRIKYVPYKAMFTSKIIEPVIRARLYVSNLNLNEDLNGYIINISLSFSRTDNRIIIEK